MSAIKHYSLQPEQLCRDTIVHRAGRCYKGRQMRSWQACLQVALHALHHGQAVQCLQG